MKNKIAQFWYSTVPISHSMTYSGTKIWKWFCWTNQSFFSHETDSIYMKVHNPVFFVFVFNHNSYDINSYMCPVYSSAWSCVLVRDVGEMSLIAPETMKATDCTCGRESIESAGVCVSLVKRSWTLWGWHSAMLVWIWTLTDHSHGG